MAAPAEPDRLCDRQTPRIALAWTEGDSAREITLALPGRDAPMSIADVVGLAEVRAQVPPALLARCGFAVYGKRRCPDALLMPGERLEILGPLIADPKQARRYRVERERRRLSHGKWSPERG